MSLQSFSNTLFELYAVAEQAPPDRFPAEVVRIIAELVHFDGALLGSGRADAALKTDNGGRSPLADYLEASDPATRAFIRNLIQPRAGDCKALYEERKPEELQMYSRNRDLRKLLLSGDAPDENSNARWLMLYRGNDDDFNEFEASVLRAIWRHARHTIEMNLHRALNSIDPEHMTRAQALINSRGIIEIANPAMIELLKLEWPSFNARTLPLVVLTDLLSTGKYRGWRIEISASQKFGYMACIARPVPVVDTLTPSEMNVADRFAQGMTHSQIAAQLKVSPHTVRNQLAQVYLKLGIHSKVALVRVLSGHRPHTFNRSA